MADPRRQNPAAAKGGAQDAPAHVVRHPLEPIYDARSRVLVLGTMPSPASRAASFYYAHPRNRFWRVMEALFSLPDRSLSENGARRAFLLEQGIALWDVLASCSIAGASDASIADPAPNDLARVLDAAPVRAVFTTGAKATALYRKLCEPALGVPAFGLPSTSPANARMSLEELVEAYRPILRALRPPEGGPCAAPLV